MEKFLEIGCSIGKLVKEKNDAYGNSFAKSGRILEILFPDGIPTDSYEEVLVITRIIDKLFRVANKKRFSFNEDAWRDIAGYAILMVSTQPELQSCPRQKKKNQEDFQNTIES